MASVTYCPKEETGNPKTGCAGRGGGGAESPQGGLSWVACFQGKESGCQVPGGQSWWGSGSSSAVWGHEETQELATRACGASNDNNVPVECAFFKLHS